MQFFIIYIFVHTLKCVNDHSPPRPLPQNGTRPGEDIVQACRSLTYAVQEVQQRYTGKEEGESEADIDVIGAFRHHVHLVDDGPANVECGQIQLLTLVPLPDHAAYWHQGTHERVHTVNTDTHLIHTCYTLDTHLIHACYTLDTHLNVPECQVRSDPASYTRSSPRSCSLLTSRDTRTCTHSEHWYTPDTRLLYAWYAPDTHLLYAW